MIKKKYIFILFAFSISFWLSGCIKDPKVVGISNLEIVEKVDSMLLTTMTTQIENPNKMSITASDLEYSIMLQGREIGQGFVKEEFTLKANEITDIQNTIELNISKLLKTIDFIMESDSFPVDISVSAKISPMGLKINKKTQVYFKLADFMKNLSGDLIKESLKIKGLKITEIKPSYTKMDIKFGFENKFPFSYTLDSLNFEIFDNEKMESLLGSTKKTDKLIIEAKNDTNFSVNAQIQNINAGLSMFKKVFTNERGFYIKGTVFIDFEKTKIKIPIQQVIEPI